MKFVVSKEVEAALAARAPVVALETSVLAQGLPYPTNLEAHRKCEAAIRAEGAVPAACAMFDGQLYAGLDEVQASVLAQGKTAWKLGSRDLAIAAVQRATGATTVSATCEVAALTGISFFSTGGIGGVHRGVTQHFDMSQDLSALARLPVAVICAGPKSVLDVPKTMELLETLGVPVLGFGTNQLPGFYSLETGVTLEHSVSTPMMAAETWRARRSFQPGGLLITVPPPAQFAISRLEMEQHIELALRDAEVQGVSGKAVTPFLLAEVARRTEGRSRVVNVALLENNARVAAKIAVAHSSLEPLR